MSDDYKYAAFISYSSRDAAFARKLRSALEAYLLPPTFGAVKLAGATKSRRVYPVCRDRDELPAGELGPLIEANLKISACLVVICSPNSAASPWVAKEIEHFASLGRRDRIFAIIPDSAPLTASVGGDPTATFFPKPLEGIAEHLAADARKTKDGFRNALLKIVAGIAGVNLGRLIDRDAEARRRRLVRLSIVGAAVSALVVAISTAWFLESRHARQMAEQRLLAEMRDAFESADYPRAVSLLAHLRRAGGADADYDKVLARWLARYGALGPALDAAPATFGFDGRQYHKSGAGIAALPFGTEMLVATSADGGFSIGMDSAGRLWELSRPDPEPKPASLKSGVFAAYDWDSVVILNSGAIIFSGRRQSSYAGGAYPTLLFLNQARAQFTVLTFETFDQDQLRIASDCSAIEWRGADRNAGSSDPGENGIEFVDRGSAVYRFELEGSAGAAAVPAFDTQYSIVDSDPSSLQALVAKCGDQRAFTPRDENDTGLVGHRALGLTLPIETSSSPWQSQDAGAPEPDPWYAEAHADIRDAAQRFRISEAGEFGGDAPATEDYAAQINRAQANALEQTVMASPDGAPVLFSYGSSGAQFGAVSLCVLPGERARCSYASIHGNAGAYGNLGRFMYVQDFAYLGHPLFHLFELASGRRIPVAFAETEGLSGPRPEGVAISPDGARLAMILDGRVLLVGLDAEFNARIVDWFDLAVAAALPKDEFNSADAALTFLDGNRLAGVGSNGLAFAIDIAARKELWRFRVPNSVVADAVPAIAVSTDGALIAVRAKGVAAVLDAQTGLPMDAVLAFYDEPQPSDLTEPVDPQTGSAPVDMSCGYLGNAECLSRAELLRTGGVIAERLAAPPPVEVIPQGFAFAAGRDTHFYLFSSSPALDRGAMLDVACRTGWAVINDNAVRFNPLARITVGGPPAARAAFDTCER